MPKKPVKDKGCPDIQFLLRGVLFGDYRSEAAISEVFYLYA